MCARLTKLAYQAILSSRGLFWNHIFSKDNHVLHNNVLIKVGLHIQASIRLSAVIDVLVSMICNVCTT